MAVVLRSFLRNLSRPAVVDSQSTFTYAQILSEAVKLRAHLGPFPSSSSQQAQARVAYLVPRDGRYIVSKTATWLAGGIGVPLAENHPPEELRYTLEDSGATYLLTTPERKAELQPIVDALKIQLIEVFPLTSGAEPMSTVSLTEAIHLAIGEEKVTRDDEKNDKETETRVDQRSISPLVPSPGAFLIYTSGTTGRPKGVLTTHVTLAAQIHAMATAWRWSETDRIYSVLPLHHVHGIVAIVLTALASGACVELAPRFDAIASWRAFSRPPANSLEQALLSPGTVQPTLFMAVPTVYVKMLEAHKKTDIETQNKWIEAVRSPQSQIRLMVSGSAALPESVATSWRTLTGHTLLERYGMTEFAMAISNPYDGERKVNTVGKPLPGYKARLVPEIEGSDPRDGGELQITGPGVFTEYWVKPEATKDSFTETDHWFKTGDRAIQDADGYFSIQGRLSADILKMGGYKISALDIERVLLEHPLIAEIAVLGLPDDTWGEKVVAIVVLKEENKGVSVIDDKTVLNSLREFGAANLAPYKLPTVVKILQEMPRNAMGKVNKKALRKDIFGV
jgi:malonyl-CoA/methylmalonyl-CoA synthetase